MRQERGCLTDAPIPGKWNIAGTHYQRCPIRLLTPQTLWLLRIYGHYRHGFLPTSGGLFEQSNRLLQAMEIINEEIVNLQNEVGNSSS